MQKLEFTNYSLQGVHTKQDRQLGLAVPLYIYLFCLIGINTVDENIIRASKMRNNFASVPCKAIALNLLCFIFGIISLILYFIYLSKVITLPNVAIAICVALKNDSDRFSKKSDNYRYRVSWKMITIQISIEKRSHE